METINKNIGPLKQLSQLSRENNEWIKQVNNLKSGMEDTHTELEQVKKTMRMLNSGTIALDDGKNKKGHEGLRFKGETSQTKSHTLKNVVKTCRTHYHNDSRKNVIKETKSHMLLLQEAWTYPKGMFSLLDASEGETIEATP